MEMSQWNTLYSYFKQAKCLFSCKIGEQEFRTGPDWGIDTSGKGENMWEGGEYKERV
jgi:hypothetical protein